MLPNIFFLALVFPFIFLPTTSEPSMAQIYEAPEPHIIVLEQPKDYVQLSHQQEVWISALEWCESNGRPEAVNNFDSDGTPSYYSYQFKTGTFRGFGELYGVIKKEHTHEEIMLLIKDTTLQRQIVRRMINDASVDITKQFPGCVRKIGRPPVY